MALQQAGAMSGAEGWSRRATLGGALALASLPAVARSQTPGVKRLLGIRYGRAKRFMPPEPAPWGMVDLDSLNAYGPACPQQGSRYTPQDEDCLFLNLWAPRSRPARPRPGATPTTPLRGGGCAAASAP